jgi:hypothetical protein
MPEGVYFNVETCSTVTKLSMYVALDCLLQDIIKICVLLW